jgi:Slime mold cyclic AMP receptor
METNDESIYYIVALVGSVLSFISSAFIVYIYYRSPSFQTYSCKFIRYLCMTDALLSICNIYIAFMIPSFLTGWLCSMQAVCTAYFLLSSILWTAAISHALHTVVVNPSPDFQLMERRYLMLTYGLPAVSLVLLLVENDYGSDGRWCWIAYGVGSNVLLIIFYYVPLLTVITYNIIQYKRVVKELDDNSFIGATVPSRLKFYPCILIATQISPSVYRILKHFTSDSIEPLAIIGVLSTTLMGLGNALLYGFTDAAKEFITNCCNREDTIDNSLESVEYSSMVQNSLNR